MVLTDFGIAKAHDSSTQMTATGTVIGTPHYMSPEQAQGQELDHRSDIYSIGIVLYEMLTGAVPFQGNSALSIGIKHLKESVPPLPANLIQYQPLINKILAKNPDERFQSGEDLAHELESLLAPGNDASITQANTIVAAADTPTIQADQAATIVQSPTQATTQTATQVPEKKSSATTIVSIFVLAGLAAGGYWYLQQQRAMTNKTPTVAAAKPQASQNQVNSEQIKKLLGNADKALKTSNLLTPKNNNALDYYQQVLALDAGNLEAKKGISEISQHFVTLAEHAIEKDDLAQAKRYLKLAEEIDAANPLIFSRRLALKEAQDNKLATTKKQASVKNAKSIKTEKDRIKQKNERQKKLAAREKAKDLARTKAKMAAAQKTQFNNLLTQANNYLSPSELTSTRISLAYDLYREAIKISPSDTTAAQGPVKVANAYMSIAATQLEDSNYTETDKLITAGLAIQPRHSGLLSLKKQLTEKQAEPKRRTFGGF
jgi:hypothetical protein